MDVALASGATPLAPSVRRSLTATACEAAVVGGMFACLEAWIVPLVQGRLGAPAAIIGAMAMLPQLANILIGPFSGRIIRRLGGPRTVAIHHCWTQVVGFLLLQIPLAASTGGTPPGWAVPMAVTIVVIMNGVGGVLGGPAWVAWMGGLIPPRVMGRFSGNRNRIFHTSRLAFAGLFAGIMAVLPLTAGITGLQIVLALATVSRLGSTLLQFPQIDPAQRPGPKPTESRPRAAMIDGFGAFLRSMTSTQFGRFTMIWALMNFGLNIAGPYYATYLVAQHIKGGLDLGGQALLYSVLIYTNTAIKLFFYPMAGRMVDRLGPLTVFNRGMLLLILVPAGWAISALTGLVWPILLTEIVSGFAWSLTDTAGGPIMFRCHPDPHQRAHLVAWHSTVINACCITGTGLGMLIIAMPHVGGVNPYLVLFLASLLLRIPSVVLIRRMMPEVGADGKPLPLWHLFSSAGFGGGKRP